jgi:hypothetical protein
LLVAGFENREGEGDHREDEKNQGRNLGERPNPASSFVPSGTARLQTSISEKTSRWSYSSKP